MNAARRRMARVPEGGSLVKNPVQGPPGFQIGNVFVLAGVPPIMRGMLEDVGPRLRSGAVVDRAHRAGRGRRGGRDRRAAGGGGQGPSGPVARQLSVLRAEGFGSNLVIRGRDEAEVAATVDELVAAELLTAIGAMAIIPLAPDT